MLSALSPGPPWGPQDRAGQDRARRDRAGRDRAGRDRPAGQAQHCWLCEDPLASSRHLTFGDGVQEVEAGAEFIPKGRSPRRFAESGDGGTRGPLWSLVTEDMRPSGGPRRSSGTMRGGDAAPRALPMRTGCPLGAPWVKATPPQRARKLPAGRAEAGLGPRGGSSVPPHPARTGGAPGACCHVATAGRRGRRPQTPGAQFRMRRTGRASVVACPPR